MFDFIVNSVIKFHSVLQSDASTTSKGDFFRDCILRELKGWVYILTHEVSGFRDPLEHLINSILISPCANSPAATVGRQKMLKEINNLMDMVIDLIPKNELASIENYRSNKGKETVPFKNIFSLLRNCLFTIDEKEKVYYYVASLLLTIGLSDFQLLSLIFIPPLQNVRSEKEK